MLLTCIGQKGREIYKTFTFNSADDQMILGPVLNTFSEYGNRRKNVTILHHKFFLYRQLEGQSFHNFITSNGLPISCKIDTGAQCNVDSLKMYQKLNPQPDLHPVNLKLSGYNNSKIPVIGKCSLTLEHKNELFNVSFLVVDRKSVPIHGLESCKNLKLIKRICSVESKENLFLS